MPLAEQEMYSTIEIFLKERGCERVLIEKVGFDYIKRWIIDVAGVKEARIYAVEAKPKLTFDSFSAALTQARYYRQACTHVYICMPEPSRMEENELLEHIKKICDQEKTGLLLFTSQQRIREEKEAIRSEPDLDKYFYVMQQLTSESPSDKIQGARAFIVRDLCYYLAKDLNREAQEDELRNHFLLKMPKSEKYWREAYINPRTKPERTLEATIIAAEELKLIERYMQPSKDGSFTRLTNLGKELVDMIEEFEVGKAELDRQVKAFFHALSQRYPEVRTTIQILKEFRKRMRFGQNECASGHKFWAGEAVIGEGTIQCPKCQEKLDLQSEKTSLLCRLILKLHYYPYPQLVFWINSKVLPIKSLSRNRFVEYSPP